MLLHGWRCVRVCVIPYFLVACSRMSHVGATGGDFAPDDSSSAYEAARGAGLTVVLKEAALLAPDA